MHYPPEQPSGYPPEQPSYPPQPNMQYPQQPMHPPYQQVPPPGYYPPQQPVFVQVNAPRKSRAGLIIGVCVAIGVVLAMCGLFATVASHSPSTTVSTTTSTTTDTGSSNQPANSGSTDSGNTVAEIGQTITVDSVSCTVTSAKVLASDQYLPPKQGMHYVVVHVQLANGGSVEWDYYDIDFHAKSSAGNITDIEAPPTTYTANNELNTGKLAPGGKVEGDIVFQIPVGDTGAEVTWSPSFFSTSSQYAWTLNVK